MNMRLGGYSFASDPDSKKTCLVYFGESGEKCGILFDVPKPNEWEDYPKPLCDFAMLLDALGRHRVPKDCHVVDWVSMELLRRHVNGEALPSDGESGIERYFRELGQMESVS